MVSLTHIVIIGWRCGMDFAKYSHLRYFVWIKLCYQDKSVVLIIDSYITTERGGREAISSHTVGLADSMKS